MNQKENSCTGKLKIFIIPHAGGNKGQYHELKRTLSHVFDPEILELPYRQLDKPNEDLPSWQEWIDMACETFLKRITGPFILMGHSLGSLMAYELLKKAQKSVSLPDYCLICSSFGAPTPTNIQKIEHISHLDDFKFIEKLERYSAIPEALKKHSQFYESFVWQVRRDFQLLESYTKAPGESEKIKGRIMAFAASLDTIHSFSSMTGWSQFTENDFQLQVYPGGHFYLLENPGLILKDIPRSLS